MNIAIRLHISFDHNTFLSNFNLSNSANTANPICNSNSV